jgi:hypothetical protein
MTSASASAKPPEPSKLGDRIDRIFFFVWVAKLHTPQRLLELFFCRFVSGFCQDDALMLSFYTLS